MCEQVLDGQEAWEQHWLPAVDPVTVTVTDMQLRQIPRLQDALRRPPTRALPGNLSCRVDPGVSEWRVVGGQALVNV